MTSKKPDHEVRRIRTDQIKQPPIRHKRGLSPLLTHMARELFQRVGHIMYPTFEQWELGFLRDMWPWHEILVWESISRVYGAYITRHPAAASDTRTVATIVAVATGGVFGKKEARKIQEIRTLLSAAWSERWKPFLGPCVDFPADAAISLGYREIIDEHGGNFDPYLRGAVDPRNAIAEAQVIFAADTKPPHDNFIIFGRDLLGELQGKIPEGTRVLMIALDIENTKTEELNKILAAVKVIKGSHHCE